MQIQIKNRKLNRLKGYNYSRAGCYFITICTKNREHFFGKIINGRIVFSDIGKITKKCWQEIPTHFPNTKLDQFIIMPNHIHGIVIIHNVGNNDYCSDDGNENVGNNDYCSPRSLRQPWQTKWARSLSSVVRGFKIGVKNWYRDNNAVGNKNFCSHYQNNNHYSRYQNNNHYSRYQNKNYYSQQFAWQKSYYDHIIRDEKSLNRIRQYIINNPLKWERDRNNLENLLI